MELKPDRLERQLAGEPLRPVYLVAGGEPLLVQEAADAIRARAREEGYGEREVYDADGSFNWNTLTQGVASLSLFATRRLFDLRLPTGKPGKDGSEALREYCDKRAARHRAADHRAGMVQGPRRQVERSHRQGRPPGGGVPAQDPRTGRMAAAPPAQPRPAGHARRRAPPGRPRRGQPAGRRPGSGQAGAAGRRGQGPEVRGHRRGADGAAGRRLVALRRVQAGRCRAGRRSGARRAHAGRPARRGRPGGRADADGGQGSADAVRAGARRRVGQRDVGHARGAHLGKQAGDVPARARAPSAVALGGLRRRMRPHRPHGQGPRRRRRLADARAPAGRHRRRPGAQAAGLMALALLYGGTFDPVHAGHLAVARAARDALGADVAFLPAADPPHRAAPGASAEQRARMIELAIAGEPGFSVDRRELQRAGPSWTVDTLRDLRAERGPAAPLAWLVGADAFRGLPTWHDWRELLDLAHFVVAVRPGHGLDALPGDLAEACAGRWLDHPGRLARSPAGGLFRLDMPLHPGLGHRTAPPAAGRRAARGLAVAPPVADFIGREGLYRGGTAPAGV